ncbi:MAG: HNH endonuclease [Gemmataceae bacterium]
MSTTQAVPPPTPTHPAEFEHQGVRLRPLPRFPGYWCGDDGGVWSTKKGTPKRLKEQTLPKLRMQVVSLYRPDRRYDRLLSNGTVKSCMLADVRYVHLLVASVWLPPKPAPGYTIDHEDEDRTNNRPGNLRWMTVGENNRAYLDNHPDLPRHRGEGNGQAKLTEGRVLELRTLRGRMTQRMAADLYGVAKSTVASVWRGRTWRHVG